MNSRGSAYIEFLLVFPILSLMSFGGLEYTRALNQLQLAVSLSREIANIAYRECIADAQQVSQANNSSYYNQNACLKGVRDKLVQQQNVNALLPDVEFVITSYSYVPATGGGKLEGKTVYGTSVKSGAADYRSKYSAAQFSVSPELNEALSSYGNLVTAEVFIPYRAFILRSVPHAGFSPSVIYGTTIL